MKVFYHTEFTGHYDVGTSAVIVAESRTRARNLLRADLKRAQLDPDEKDIMNLDCSVEIDMTKAKAIILQDGQY